MKKILSCILAAAMLVGMLTFGAVAETPNQMLKFNDILGKGEGGDQGMANYMGSGISSAGYTVTMDFIYGRSGVCYHPTDTTMKHTSKFAIYMGESEGTHKYVGYSATEDVFFLGTGSSSPVYGEGADGIEFLAASEKGLIIPGEKYTVAYEFTYDTGCKIYLDGKEILSFDLYEDLRYPTYFPHQSFMMYPTHITCFIDNFALYAAGTYDATTGEATADPVGSTNFDTDAEMKEFTQTSEEGENGEEGETTTSILVSSANWQIVKPAYTLAVADNDIYAQPQYPAGESDVNVVFESGLDRKSNGADETFASGKDFNIDLTIKNNKGLDSLTLDLVSDEYITVKSVVAADGLTATLGETDADGITKLTITGSKYTGEALATITYTMSESAVQEFSYSYGAKVDTMAISGAEGMENAILTNGSSVVYNFSVGDMNDDRKFDMTDVVIILKVVAKWNLPDVFKDAGDVNGDGRTNSMDVSYYLRWIAKWTKDYTINGITYY